jgi:hypothetical protein
MQQTHSQERRRTRRVKIGQPFKIRPSDPKDEHFEETNTTKNASREGIYFLTRRESYYEGMRLFVTLPHHFPNDPLSQEYIGQVTRIERLQNGQWGVALQLLSSVGLKPAIVHTRARWK